MKHKDLFLIVIVLVGLAASCFGAQSALQVNPAPTNNDYVALGINQYNPILNGVSGITFEGWIKPTSIPGTARIFHLGIQGPGLTAIALELFANGSMTAYARSDDGETTAPAATSAAGVISAGNWYHVAIIANYATGFKSIRLIVNGTEVASNLTPPFLSTTYVSGSPVPTHNDIFGAYLPPSDQRPYIGLIDEFRLWNYPRDLATEILPNMFNELDLTQGQPGLIGYWMFNEDSGTTAIDSSPSGKNGTLVNFGPNPRVEGAPDLDPPVTLPVELSSFTAVPTAEYFVQLNWITQTETNVSGFRIYRGRSIAISEAINLNVFINATNTASTQTYTYLDNSVFEDGTYYYWLENIDLDGNTSFYGPIAALVYHNGNPGDVPDIPITIGIEKIFPNPFNPSTTISYLLENDADVNVTVYNLKGQVVRQLLNESRIAGSHRVQWNGMDENGMLCSSGVYTVKVQIGSKVYSRNIVMSK